MNGHMRTRSPVIASLPSLMRMLGFVLAMVSVALVTGCTHERSFAKDVQPIIQVHCIQCHQPGGAGYERSGLDMTTYDGLMKGTKFGQVVVPGDSMDSVLIQLIEHRADPAIHMPFKHPKLSDSDIKTLSTWVEQGAKP